MPIIVLDNRKNADNYLNCVPCSIRILGGPRSLTRADCETGGKPGTEASQEYAPAVLFVRSNSRKGPLD